MTLLDEVKAYCHLEDSDDPYSLLLSAETYLEGYGISRDETNSLYCLAVKMLITSWSDNKDGKSNSNNQDWLNSIITQLKYRQAVT